MSEPHQVVLFLLGEQRFTVPLSRVERVVRAVEPTSLPSAPEGVLGVANVQGRIVPVVDLRARLRMATREMEPSDQFILVRASSQTVALLVNSVCGVLRLPSQGVIPAGQMLHGVEHVEGIVKGEDGLLTLAIADLEGLLPLEMACPSETTKEAQGHE